ncbi:tRNA (N6-isopentenyl adenosine(37)-C2)-methylthiotransferase MiaB [uncultured Algibacter sp.]|uniref:tRNA (N6-isopentenyl adenosine(37)-C2)-methylthiotransferase MiaB n=1 Tax=uncultured Algibacter sp. TaxID=298659 RepID=UPI0032165E97
MEKTIDENKQGQSLVLEQKKDNKRKLFIESYGCAMNFSDSEIVASIMANQGFNTTQNLEEADLVLVNTCSIRDKAEQTVRKRLEKYNAVKRDLNPKMKVGVLGCMAERLKTKFLEEEKIVDLVVGPDAYKDLPNLIAEVDQGREAINVILSKDETYGDISPVRLNTNGVTAFVSITRGCDNMCTFCVVPFTRGRERSRDPQSIIKEVNDLWDKGYKEITLLGQNVDSYLWYGGGLKKDFEKANDMQKATAVNFSGLLELCAKSQPKMRIRFSTSNPQDLTLDVIKTMAKFDNICNHIHLPVQSGSDKILKAMNRLHTRKEYMKLIDNIREIIPNCSISQDMIVGFPTETETDFKDTVSLMDYVKYNFGYMFTYSERPGTMAGRNMEDDVPEEIKKRRLQDIVDLQRAHSEIKTKEWLHKTVEVLIEKESKKSNTQWSGRTPQNIVCVFPKAHYNVGDFVNVKVTDCTSATLIGEAIPLVQ